MYHEQVNRREKIQYGCLVKSKEGTQKGGEKREHKTG